MKVYIFIFLQERDTVTGAYNSYANTELRNEGFSSSLLF